MLIFLILSLSKDEENRAGSGLRRGLLTVDRGAVIPRGRMERGEDAMQNLQVNGDLNARLAAMGFEVFAPDMSMFQLGGGSVHCLSQALRRDGG